MEHLLNDDSRPAPMTLSRRRLLKALAAGGGAFAGAALLPGQWVKPVVEVGVLPAHAQTSGRSATFGNPGAAQFVVPAGVTQVTIGAWGAQGGAGVSMTSGGLGAHATGTIAVTPGETLFVNVGGVGGAGGVGGIAGGNGGAGGVNFGGAGGVGGAGGNGGVGGNGGAGGGGASDVRQGDNGLDNRVIVAGGGGSSLVPAGGTVTGNVQSGDGQVIISWT
jgi:hypothetical protein